MTIKVRPEDAIGLDVKLDGLYGWDLETVAGREEARLKMIEKATVAVDKWIASVEVLPDRPSRQ